MQVRPVHWGLPLVDYESRMQGYVRRGRGRKTLGLFGEWLSAVALRRRTF